MNRDHGGNLAAAIRQYGGALEEWIDLSTGINRQPYRLPEIPARAWQDLPDAPALATLTKVAQEAYRTKASVLPLAGAQAAIQLMPRLRRPGTVRILSPTYNEHAASFASAGWHVKEVAEPSALIGDDAAILVNPNNPDGRAMLPSEILELASHVRLLIVDESFTDPTPELSIAPHLGAPGLLALRSFGKFYGLAGLRLGFAIGAEADTAALRAAAGPWSVSGPALHVGALALTNKGWQASTTARLENEAKQLDSLARTADWQPAGGTHLFRLYTTKDAEKAQAYLAEHHIWSRIFPYSRTWLRLGLPGTKAEWQRLSAALSKAA